MDPLTNAGSFLVDTLFTTYVIIILLRILLQFAHASFNNPISQFIIKVTNPLLDPLKKYIPGKWGIDFSALLLAALFEIAKLALLIAINGHGAPEPLGFAIAILASLLGDLTLIYMFAIFIMAIISWVNPHQYTPVGEFVTQLTEPLMRPIRRVLPPIANLDMSPFVVILALYLVRILIITPLIGFA